MDITKYFSDQPTVDITVVKISGKKLTKSVLKQIPMGESFTPTFNFEGVQIMGIVSDQEKWIIYTRDERLFKSDLRLLIQIIEMQLTVENVTNFIESSLSDDDFFELDTRGSYTQLPDEDQQKFLKLQSIAGFMYSKLKSRQIYI